VKHPLYASLRLSFGGVRPEQIFKGIEILGRVFRAEIDSQKQAEREPAAAWV
jgi:DNA-binding transcriptional MocR family regulator